MKGTTFIKGGEPTNSSQFNGLFPLCLIIIHADTNATSNLIQNGQFLPSATYSDFALPITLTSLLPNAVSWIIPPLAQGQAGTAWGLREQQIFCNTIAGRRA